MVKKKVVITSNREIYNKLNLLSFCDDVILKNVNKQQISKIMSNINKNGLVVDIEKVGEYFVLKKKSPVNYAVYFRGGKK